MRKSKTVAAPLLAAAALSMMSGCRKPEMQRCVDENNFIVNDSFCHQTDPTEAKHYRYYYGGTGDYETGSRAANGSFTALAGHSYSTQRGGFGGSFPIGEWFLVSGFVGVALAFGVGG